MNCGLFQTIEFEEGLKIHEPIYKEKSMKRLALSVFAMAVLVAPPVFAKQKSDKEIKQILIKESISSYRGSCPCPYSGARNGSRCGKRSAYSRPGGASPLCYESDVTDEMVEAYRNRKKGKNK